MSSCGVKPRVLGDSSPLEPGRGCAEPEGSAAAVPGAPRVAADLLLQAGRAAALLTKANIHSGEPGNT